MVDSFHSNICDNIIDIYFFYILLEPDKDLNMP